MTRRTSRAGNPGPLAMVFLTLGFVGGVQSAGVEFELVSRPLAGKQNDGNSTDPAITPDGRYVAFVSASSSLVAGDTNHSGDVFLLDRQTGIIERASLSNTGEQGRGGALEPCVSGNGRLVAFTSSPALVPGRDVEQIADLFVRDFETKRTYRPSLDKNGVRAWRGMHRASFSADGGLLAFIAKTGGTGPAGPQYSEVHVMEKTGAVSRVSVSTSGQRPNAACTFPSLSGDGRFVVFTSEASNLVPNDTNDANDVFVHDRQTRQTTRVSLTADGKQAPGGAWGIPQISADGSAVVFLSASQGMSPKATNMRPDVYVRDLAAKTTELISVNSRGEEANDDSAFPSIGPNGRFVAFQSDARNLLPEDTNSKSDIYVFDRQKDRLMLVSGSTLGRDYACSSQKPVLACGADGRLIVVFEAPVAFYGFKTDQPMYTGLVAATFTP